jgi:hypothetical protein
MLLPLWGLTELVVGSIVFLSCALSKGPASHPRHCSSNSAYSGSRKSDNGFLTAAIRSGRLLQASQECIGALEASLRVLTELAGGRKDGIGERSCITEVPRIPQAAATVGEIARIRRIAIDLIRNMGFSRVLHRLTRNSQKCL